MVNSSVIVYAIIILSISLCKFTSVSGFTPRRTSVEYAANNTRYEIAGERGKPVTPETDDETSQEDVDGDNDDDDNDEDDDNAAAAADATAAAAEDESNETGDYDEDRNCTCSGSSCVCCINLNLSFIDLGGPGCVKFSYIPDNDSVAVNMSYGERLLESSTLKRETLEQTCMDLFSDLAQMCAKFSHLSKVTNGITGCLTVEPLLLGVSQTNYHVGCFNMDVKGLQPEWIPTPPSFQYGTKGNGTKETNSKPEENEEEELAAAISQSAEEGIAWFSNFISSVFGEETNETSTSTTTATATSTTVSAGLPQNKTTQSVSLAS